MRAKMYFLIYVVSFVVFLRGEKKGFPPSLLKPQKPNEEGESPPAFPYNSTRKYFSIFLFEGEDGMQTAREKEKKPPSFSFSSCRRSVCDRRIFPFL